MIILSPQAYAFLSSSVASILGYEHASVSLNSYPDGEMIMDIKTDLYDKDVIILHGTRPISMHHDFFELMFLMDYAKQQGAKSVTVIFSYLAYLRQDQHYGFQPLSTLRRIIGAYTHCRFYILHPHSDVRSLGMQEILPYDLYASWIDENNMKSALLIAPDQGRTSMVEILAQKQAMDRVIFSKQRINDSIVYSCPNSDAIQGRDCLIIDDMMDSGMTLLHLSHFLKESCSKSITALVTHNLATRKMLTLLQQHMHIFFTDSLPQKKSIHILALDRFLADFIKEEIGTIHCAQTHNVYKSHGL